MGNIRVMGGHREEMKAEEAKKKAEEAKKKAEKDKKKKNGKNSSGQKAEPKGCAGCRDELGNKTSNAVNKSAVNIAASNTTPHGWHIVHDGGSGSTFRHADQKNGNTTPHGWHIVHDGGS